MKRSVWIAGVCAAAVAAAAMAYFSTQETRGRANPDDSRQVELGAIVYAESCASCHGDRLEGQPDWRQRKPDGKLPAPPHDQSGHTWHHADEQLFALTKNGLTPPVAPAGYRSDMPAYADSLTDDEIWAVLSFIKSKWPSRERASQDRVDKAYRDRE